MSSSCSSNRAYHHHDHLYRRSYEDLEAASALTADAKQKQQQQGPLMVSSAFSRQSTRSESVPYSSSSASAVGCCSHGHHECKSPSLVHGIWCYFFKNSGHKKKTKDDDCDSHDTEVPHHSHTGSKISHYTNQQHNNTIIRLVSLLLFCVLAGAGGTIYFVMASSAQTKVKDSAKEWATEVGAWFAKELDLAILPIFSIAQFATELQPFRTLPDQIGDPYLNDSALPFLPNGGPVMLRNVTGICDDPEVVDRYNRIAQSVKSNSKMEGVLHNLQLSPQGVLCLAYPLNNTEDFVQDGKEDGPKFLDMSGAIGLDLLYEPKHMYIARDTIARGDIGIAGPRPLLQCQDCGLYFIVRLPILSQEHYIQVDGQEYPRWGFATALINWDALVNRSDVHERAKDKGYSFQLTRTDHTFEDATQEYTSNIVVLAESEDFHGNASSIHHVHWSIMDSKRGQVPTNLQTTNNLWVMTVEYPLTNAWANVAAIAVSVGVAFFIATLSFTVLMQRQAHAVMQGTAMAQHAKVEIERHMTAYFAHELRNPLSAIDCALTVLQSKRKTDCLNPNCNEDDSEMTDIVAGMKLCSSFMSSVMNNLLDSRKLEEGKMVLKRNPLSLTALVENVSHMMRPATQPGVELLVSVEANDNHHRGDWVFGDVHRLQQILTNVVSNSIKFTRAGSITLVAGWDEGDLVRLECRDTGPGIPKGEQQDMFQKFTTRGGAPGTGLGLSIAKQIVDLLGGSIRFESDPTVQAGTNCIILLPLSPCEEPSSSRDLISRLRLSNASQGGYGADDDNDDDDEDDAMLEEPLSILITDDIRMNRIMLKRRLQKCIAPNCIIQEAATGEEALQLCASGESFDIIIMDQYMEEAGGLLLGTDAIIAMRRTKLQSLIIGGSGNDLDHLFRSAGADIIWKKPIPSNVEIIHQLRQNLAQRPRNV